MLNPRNARRARGVRVVTPRVIAPVVMLAFGLCAASMSIEVSLGSLRDPAPGLWPFIVSILIVGSAAMLLFTDVAEDYERWDRGTARVLVGITALAGFIVLFQVLGFLFSAGLLLLVWMWFIGDESWRTAVPLAVCGAVALQLLFVDAFGVPFPQGLIVWGVN